MTRILLDTHTFLWFIDDHPNLSSTAKHILENEAETLYLSIVNIWEMAINVRIEKLVLSQPFETYIPGQIAHNAITVLDLRIDHAALLSTLPLHHRDPFDRTLIAQALIENVPILSADPKLDVYGIERVW